jgi:hypothetical protein
MKNNKKNELIYDNAFETCLYKTKYIMAADIIPFAFLISTGILSTLNEALCDIHQLLAR